MAKYIRCDCCGKRIEFGEDVMRFPGNAEIFCSEYCFADAFADYEVLNDELASDCWRKVYDDEEDKQKLKEEIAKVTSEMNELEKKLKIMQFELSGYENPFNA